MLHHKVNRRSWIGLAAVPAIFVNYYQKSTLPYELVEKIIVDAWCSIGDSYARWHFFDVISLLSKVWHNVLYDIVLRYTFIESKRDLVMYERFLLHHHPRARYISIVLDKQFRVDEIIVKFASHAEFMCLSITADRLGYFDTILQCLLAKSESLTHFRIYWPSPPLNYFACPVPSVIISSVTHLHITHYPTTSFGSVLACFPNVTHLRLGSPFSIKHYFVPHISKVRVLILDAPLCYNVYMPVSAVPRLELPTSVSRWYLLDALEHGLLKSTARNLRRIIMNAERSDPDNTRDIALSCQNHGIAFECRRVHPSYWKPIHVESRYWNHEWS